jgi:hypothetical protein
VDFLFFILLLSSCPAARPVVLPSGPEPPEPPEPIKLSNPSWRPSFLRKLEVPPLYLSKKSYQASYLFALSDTIYKSLSSKVIEFNISSRKICFSRNETLPPYCVAIAKSSMVPLHIIVNIIPIVKYACITTSINAPIARVIHISFPRIQS